MRVVKVFLSICLSTPLFGGSFWTDLKNAWSDEIVPVVTVKNCCKKPITIDIACGRTFKSLSQKEIGLGATVTFYARESIIEDLWNQEGVLNVSLKIQLLDYSHIFVPYATLCKGQDAIEVHANGKIKIIER